MKRIVLGMVSFLVVGVLAAAPAAAQEWLNNRLNEDTTLQLQNEQQVVVNPTDPSNLVAVWRDFRLGFRQVGFAYTNDRGASWTNPGLFVDVHYPRDSDPALTVNAEGDFFAMLLAYTGDTNEPNGMLMFRSTDGGVTWEDRGFAIDQVPGVFEDKEFIACDRTDSFFRGSIHMAWTRFYDADIVCVSTTDDGETWTSERMVSDQSGNQFPTPAVGVDGTVYVAWTDYSGPAIRIDSAWGPGPFGVDRTVTGLAAASADLNGNISSPGHPAMDIDITDGEFRGRIYIAYLSREGTPDYDIFIRHSDDNAQTWSASRRINDDAVGNGRDQFHPWLTVDNTGVVSVIWLDRRHDPANYTWHCYISQSFDGGITWSANQQVSTVASSPADAAPAAATVTGPVPDEAATRAGLIGEYIGIACWDGYVTPVWTDTRNGHQDTYGGALIGTAVEDEEPGLVMLRIAPNPAGGPVTLSYAIPEDGPVKLEVFDVAGRRVRTLVDRALRSGRHGFVWNGTDQGGRRVAAGSYLVRFQAAGTVETRTVTLSR